MTPTSAATDPSPAEIASIVSPPAAPYRGLDPFRYIDRDIFFERESEVRKLVRLVTMYRGVLLYGDSGTGKSSLINAGLLPAAIKEGFAPERLRVRPQRGEEIKVDRIRIKEGQPAAFLPSLFGQADEGDECFCVPLDTFVTRLMNLPAGRRPLLIFDQFEELVTLFTVAQHDARDEAEATQAAIATTLLNLLQHPDLPVKLLFVFREDYLAKIVKLFAMCPDLPDHHVRLTCPRLDSVPRIIRGPFESEPGRFKHELSSELADRLTAAMDERSECGLANLSEVQIVCRELWESPHPEQLFDEKGVQGVLDAYLSGTFDRMPDRLRDAAVAILVRMLTAAGTRNIVSREDLIESLGKEEEIDKGVLQEALHVLETDTRLVRREARNEVYFYEIVSEFLVPWIHAKRCEREARAQRRKQCEDDARARRLLVQRIAWLGLAVTSVGLVVMATLLVFIVRAYREADDARREAVSASDLASRQKEIAHSRQLAAQAVQYVDDRVDLALLLGVEASRGKHADGAKSGLFSGLAASGDLYALLRGHRGEVRSVAFSPDNETLATAGVDRTIQIWNLRSRHLARAPLKGHRGPISCVNFSSNRQTLASGGDDGTILLWDVRSGQILQTLTPDSNQAVLDVVFSPDGRRLASAGIDGTIQLWDVATGRRLGPALNGHHGRPVHDLDFSRDGKYLASAGADETAVIWDVNLRSVVFRFEGIGSVVFSVAFSPNGKSLASGLGDGRILLWNLTKQPVSNVSTPSHLNSVFRLAFHPDGRVLASGGSDKMISLWEVPSLERLPSPVGGYASNVHGIAFHPTGALLAAGLADGTVAVWNAVNNQRVRALTAPNSWDPLHFSWIRTVLSFGGSTSATFSPAGHVVVSATGTKLEAWNSATRTQILIGETNAPAAEVVFSPARGGTLVTAGCGSWDIKERRCTRGEIQFWHAAAWQTLGPSVSAHKGWMTIALHPDGRTLVSAGSDDDRLIFWDVATQKQEHAIRIEGRVFGATFSPDGKLLATATNRGLILWDSTARRQIGAPPGAEDLVVTTAFSPDGKLLAWGGRNSDISVWEVGSDRPPRLFSKHRSFVHTLAFSPDGRTLASGSNDERIILWDVESGEPKGLPLEASASVSAVAFSPDGNLLVSGTYGGPLTLWNLNIETLRSGACEVAGRNLTRDEWRRYFGDEPYQLTCAQGELLRADYEMLNGNPAAASDAFGDAVAVGLADGNALVNNSICWWGSLSGTVSTVMPACERAVELAESDRQFDAVSRAQIRDSRGVARAMRGDFAGAIDDFSFFVANATKVAPDLCKKRESWIAALKQNRNPFDAATLQALRVE